jgi:hypothetical protein
MSLRRCRFPSRSYARWPAEVEIRTLKPTRSLNTTNFREAAEFAYSLNEAAANCYYALNPVTSGRGKTAAASDTDIVRRNQYLIDVDPLSSTGRLRDRPREGNMPGSHRVCSPFL